ncbi:unnamed protein product [Amoebophrya sp. A120]|nr:unnamed protein product [Amoebophrya sp. A120]|eukprot:GSA120T00022881001.1
MVSPASGDLVAGRNDVLKVGMTVDIAGLRNAVKLNGKIGIIDEIITCADSTNSNADHSAKYTSSAAARETSDASLQLNEKFRVQVVDLSPFCGKGAVDFNAEKDLPKPVMKRCYLTRNSTCDAQEYIRYVERSLQILKCKSKKPFDFLQEEDQEDYDKLGCDRKHATADVAFELAHGVYTDIPAISQPEIKAKFAPAGKAELTKAGDRAGDGGDAGPAVAGRAESSSSASATVTEESLLPPLVFLADEGDQFVVFEADPFRDRSAQKTLLQLCVKNNFHAQPTFAVFNSDHIPRRTLENACKIFGDEFAGTLQKRQAAKQRAEQADTVLAPQPHLRAFFVADRASMRVVGFLQYHVLEGGLALDRPATEEETAALRSRKGKKQLKYNKKALQELEEKDLLMSTLPPSNGVFFGDDESDVKALDFVDRYHIDYRLVDADFRHLGLGTKLLQRLRDLVLLRCAGLETDRKNSPRPAVVTTKILKFRNHAKWYMNLDRMDMEFELPARYAIGQHPGSEPFNLIWTPVDLKKRLFDAADRTIVASTLSCPDGSAQQNEKMPCRCLARATELPLANFHGGAFHYTLHSLRLAQRIAVRRSEIIAANGVDSDKTKEWDRDTTLAPYDVCGGMPWVNDDTRFVLELAGMMGDV